MLHPALKAMSRLASNRNYDVLDNHADRFKKPDKEFEPRIKNTNSESHLGKNSSCYQAPRRRRRKQQQQQEPQMQNKSNESLIKPSINNSNISFRDNDDDDDDYDEEEEDAETNQDNENDFRIIKKSSKRLIKEDDLNTKSFIEKFVQNNFFKIIRFKLNFFSLK
jgi:hypothetical protein